MHILQEMVITFLILGIFLIFKKKKVKLLSEPTLMYRYQFANHAKIKCFIVYDGQALNQETNTGVFIGKTCFKLIYGTDKPPRECPLRRMEKTKQREMQEYYLPEKRVWVWVTVDPIFDERGKIIKIIHSTRDITDIKKAEKVLQERRTKVTLAKKVRKRTNNNRRISSLIS